MQILSEKIKNTLKTVFKTAKDPYEVADGLAIGVFIALLPIMGVQMYVSFTICKFLKKNWQIAVLAAWISNPITFVPLYIFNYWVGTALYPTKLNLQEVELAIKGWDWSELAQMSMDFLVPLFMGSAIVGAISALVLRYLCLKMYPEIKKMFTKLKSKKDHDAKK